MLNQDYKEMLSLLLDEGVIFVLVGAYALAIHGFPRATGDIDIFVKPDSENAKKVYNALARFGAPIKKITTEDFAEPGIIYQIGVVPRRIDIITKISGLSFDSVDEDKIIIDIEGLSIPVISKEKLIINKESSGRKEDILDAEKLKKI